MDDPSPSPSEPGWRLITAVELGVLLNPLNSSMIAVALVPLQSEFGVGVSVASWLISGFYLAAAVGTPLMGRLADQFGPRRIFLGGLALVGVTGVLAPLAPSFGWLVAARVLQALGSSAAFPAGLAMIRAVARRPRPPARALAWLAIGSSTSASLGPTVGGLLIGLAGWRAIFFVNVAVVLIALAAGLRWLPSDPPAEGGPEGGLSRIDLVGLGLFAAAVTGLLGFLLSLSSRPLWPLLPVFPIAAALLGWWELRAREPFIDVGMLVRNRALIAVFAQFAAVNLVFYAVFFALPMWLEQVRGLGPAGAGLALLPLTGLAVLVTPLAANLVTRIGAAPVVTIGAVALTAGSLALLVLQDQTPVAVILAAGLVLGVPNAFNNMGLQAALYQAAPADAIGAASGQYQTFRYVGAILSSSLLGVVFERGIASSGLHLIAIVLAAISALLVVASLAEWRRKPA
jgi:MFS family permease